MLAKHDFDNIVTVDGLKVATRPNSSDQIIIKDNLEWHAWEKHGIKISPGDAWLDFGGYIGTFSLRVLSLGGRVLAFEPDPVHQAYYLYNMELNDFDAHIVPVAVVQEDRGPLQLTRNDFKGNWAANTLFPYWKRPRGSVTVSCMSFPDAFRMGLETLQATELSIKMDIEGAEIEILEHLTADYPIKQLAAEYHFFVEKECSKWWKIQAHLESLGWTVKTSDKVPKEGLWPNPRKHHIMIYCTKGA